MKKKALFYFAIIFVGVLILFSCKSIEPLPPIEKIVDPPIAKPKISFISIPVDYNLEKTFKDAENSIPKKFTGKESECEGLSYVYNLNRESIQFSTNENGLNYLTKLKYNLDLSYCPKCTSLFNDKGNCIVPRFYGSCGIKEPMRNASISFSSKISLLPNYTLKSETSLSKLELIDPCEITLVNYNITSILDREIRKEMKTIEKEIDTEISKIDIKSSCNLAWKELQNPISIGSYGYLNIQPERIALSDFEFKNNHVYFDIGIESNPVVSSDKKQTKISNLPNYVPYSNKEGFQINLDIYATYDSLNSWIRKSFTKNTLEVKGRNVNLDTIRIIGADGSRFLTEIVFSGFRKGKLYFSVKPILDIENQKILLSDLQMDLKTKSILLKTAKWLMSDKISKKIEQEISLDLKEIIQQAKQEISKSLNTNLNEGTSLKGNVKTLNILEIYPLKAGVFIRSEITGKMKLKIN